MKPATLFFFHDPKVQCPLPPWNSDIFTFDFNLELLLNIYSKLSQGYRDRSVDDIFNLSSNSPAYNCGVLT